MISNVTIKNFESWKNTYIELSKGVSVIVGESDQGKSGIIRALTWNAQNRPRGDSFRNDFLTDKKECVSVTVTYDENIIERKRNATSTNQYTINNQEPMLALRSDVPIEISNLTKMKKVNIQSQHPSSQYFLLADKPGEVAKRFNKVAGLEIMDKAIADISSQVRTANSKISLCKEEIETREKQIQDFEWVEKAQVHAGKLKKINVLINKKQAELTYLDTITTKIKLLEQDLICFGEIDNALIKLDLLIILKNSLNAFIERRNSLIYNSNIAIELGLRLSEIHSIDLALPALNELLELYNQRVEIKRLCENICKLAQSLDYKEKEIKIVKMEFKKASEEFEKVRVTSVCPTCGRGNKNE